MSDKLQRARHIRPNPPDPTDGSAAPLGRHGRPSASGDGDASQAQGAPRNNPRANAEARIPARGRHRGVDKTLLRPPTDPGATGLIPVVGSHAGLDRTIPGATAEGSIRQQEVIVAEAAEDEVANRGGEGSGALSAESVGASAALISICVIISRITGFARTWAMAFALGSTFVSSSYQVANNLPNMLYELVMGGMLITAFLPVYLSVKKQLGDRRGNEYASNLLTIVVALLAIVSVLCMVFAGQIIYTQSFYSNQDEMALAVFFFQFFAIQIVFYGASSIVSGLLNANREYFWSSFAPVFNNLIVIASFILYAVIAQTDQNLAFLAIAIGNPLGVFVQMAFQIPALKKVGIRLRPRIDWHDPALADTLRLGAPAVFVTVCSFATVSAQNAASYVFADNGPSVIAYARLWFTFPYSFLAVPVTTTLFTELSDMQADENTRGVVAGIIDGTRQILFLMIPMALYLHTARDAVPYRRVHRRCHRADRELSGCHGRGAAVLRGERLPEQDLQLHPAHGGFLGHQLCGRGGPGGGYAGGGLGLPAGAGRDAGVHRSLDHRLLCDRRRDRLRVPAASLRPHGARRGDALVLRGARLGRRRGCGGLRGARGAHARLRAHGRQRCPRLRLRGCRRPGGSRRDVRPRRARQLARSVVYLRCGAEGRPEAEAVTTRKRDSMAVKLKSPAQIEAMKEAGRVSALALRRVGEAIEPGITTAELDAIAEKVIRAEGGIPAFKGYGGFPGSICASVNDAVVHGIPSRKLVLREGDIISIDTGAIVDGWVGDNAWTYPVGKVAPEVQRLLEVGERCMWEGLDNALPTKRLGDIGHAVQSLAEAAGYSVVRDYVGHGIGREMHEDPNVPNFGRRRTGLKLLPGMVLAIEPMVNAGTRKVKQCSDGWLVRTRDGKPSVHFEKTVAITEDGPVVLTTEEGHERPV